MRHSWDYGDRDARTAMERRCAVCWMTGRRYRPGSRAWDTYGRSGVILGGARVPPCPGTPWQRYTFGDESVSWVLRPDSEHDLIPVKIVTPGGVAAHGRRETELNLSELKLPPLPEEAWEDLLPRWTEIDGGWMIPSPPGPYALIITSLMISSSGRKAIEERVEAYGGRPLPGEAWGVLAR